MSRNVDIIGILGFSKLKSRRNSLWVRKLGGNYGLVRSHFKLSIERQCELEAVQK